MRPEQRSEPLLFGACWQLTAFIRMLHFALDLFLALGLLIGCFVRANVFSLAYLVGYWALSLAPSKR